MAISDEERRMFEALERDMEKDDPAFVRRMSQSSANARSILLNVGIFVLGIIILLSGVAMENTLVGIAGFAGMIYAGLRAMTGKGIISEITDDGSGIDPNLRV